MQLQKQLVDTKYTRLIRTVYGVLIGSALVVTIVLVAILYTKQVAFDMLWYQTPVTKLTSTGYINTPFPVGVHPADKTITEKPEVDTFLKTQLASYTPKRTSTDKDTWMSYIIAKLAQLNWYQNLASANGRILVVRRGARKEEIIASFQKILSWTQEDAQTFSALVISTVPALAEGKFFPAQYLVSKDATPEKVADIITQRFNSEIATRYPSEIQRLIPMDEALIIASILEREAYDFIDMREISGIIWNRLFIDMKLQIDATLQYAKGTNSISTWYPPVQPDDKYIDSPFNTYANKGLPPAPIGNPSSAAVLAALNPKKTNCLFYFHDKNSQFHCSETYEEHVRLLKQYYGRGK